MPPSVLDAQRLAHHLFETKLTSSHLHSRDGVLEENESAPHLSRTTSSFQDPLARRPRSTPRSRSALVLLILAFPIIMAIMLFSICKVSLTRRQTSRMIPRRLAYGGDDMDDSDLFSLMEECLAMEEEVGLVPPEPNSSPSSDMSTGIVDLDAVLSATAAVHAPTPVGPHSAWDTGAAAMQLSPDHQQTYLGEQPVGGENTSELQQTASQGAAFGGEGLSGALSAPDPDSWDDILAAINSQSESQHQKPSELQQTALQGAAFGGEGLSGALSALDPDSWDDILAAINSQSESQHQEPSELQQTASQGAAFGGEGLSGALSALDPDAWNDMLSTINSQPESQHQKPSELQQTASQGAAFGGEGLSGALSALDPDAWDDILSIINSQPESQHQKPSELQHMASQGAAFGGEGLSGALSALDPDAWNDILSIINSQPESQHQEPSELQHMASQGAAFGGEGLSGAPSALDPDAWDDILSIINSQPESQHQKPSELQHMASQGAAFGGEGPSGALSAVDPDAWDDIISVINSQPESQSQQPVASGSNTWTTGAQLPPSAMHPLPSTSGPLNTALGFQLPIESHPYVRTPVLEPGVVPKCLLPAGALNPIRMNTSSYSQLLTLRRLFLQRTLSQSDTDAIADALEKLATKTARRARRSVRQARPLFAASTLGSYFLVFDYVVAALQVFGYEQLPEWWGEFVAAFDIDYYYRDPRSGSRENALFNTQLANSLLAALKIYRTGARPPFPVIIELKRQLFFSKWGPQRFRNHQWDPWRADYIFFQNRNHSTF